MATATSRLGLRKVEASDPIRLITDFNDNMDKLDAVAGFEPRTDFPTDPHIGKAVLRTDHVHDFPTGSVSAYVWNGGTWKEILMRGAPRTVETETNATRTGSTSYGTLSPALEDTFRVPASGNIFVSVAASLRNSSAGVLAGYTYEIYEGSSAAGTLKIGASDSRELITRRDVFFQGEYRSMITDLTPFATHFIRDMGRTSTASQTSTYGWRRLMIERA